jgi:AdoMet-dependent heme synthase
MTALASPDGAVRTLSPGRSDRPFLVIWEVTKACQLACAHCRATSIPDRNPGELSTAEGCAMLDDIAAWGPPRQIVVLTGGDPFQRGDLAELVRHGASTGLSMALAPSVTPRLTRDALVEMRDAGARAISLSLDGASAATHDGFRGVDGVFEATWPAARAVVELGFRLQINTTVTRSNVLELPAMLQRVAEVGTGLWSVFFLVQTGRGEDLDALEPAEVEDVMHWLHDISHHLPVKTTEAPYYRRVAIQRARGGAAGTPERGALWEELTARTRELMGAGTGERRARPPMDVNAGRGFVFIDHLGTVQPSGFLPIAVGSVRERPLREIYRDAPLLRALRDPSGFGGRCGRCEYREVCGGSRSRAYAATGDPLAEDPTCLYEPAGSEAG